uniref:CBM21 domain-containing protein n=1 Tax=Heterorhabditis bacteriophora TaxID=37862 RepID=A0A1I7XR39_HETBA
MDREAAFQPCTSKIYDTFTFEINLPIPYDKGAEVIFCICYIANGAENWDSNGGDNYRVCCSEKNQEHKKRSSHIFGSNNYLDRDDAYKLEHTEWTNFASWKNLSTSGPYW